MAKVVHFVLCMNLQAECHTETVKLYYKTMSSSLNIEDPVLKTVRGNVYHVNNYLERQSCKNNKQLSKNRRL